MLSRDRPGATHEFKTIAWKCLIAVFLGSTQIGCFATAIGDPLHQSDWKGFNFGPSEQVRVCTWRDYGVSATEVQDWLEAWNTKHEEQVGLTVVPIDKGELPRNGFTHTAITDSFEKQVPLTDDCDRDMYFVGRNVGDFLFGVLAVTTLPLAETLGETDDQTLTHAFVVERNATLMNFVFSPAAITEHEIWRWLGCKQHYDWDRCYPQIAMLKMQEASLKETGYFKRIGEQPFYSTWDNLSDHLLVSRAEVNSRRPH